MKFNSDHGIPFARYFLFPHSDLLILYFYFNFNSCQIEKNADSNLINCIKKHKKKGYTYYLKNLKIFLWKKDAFDCAVIRVQVVRLPVDCSNHSATQASDIFDIRRSSCGEGDVGRLCSSKMATPNTWCQNIYLIFIRLL